MASIVSYYTLISELEYVGSMSKDWDAALDLQISTIPRARMTGEMLRIQLAKFKATGYRDDVVLALSRQEIIVAARAKGYPLEEVLSEALQSGAQA